MPAESPSPSRHRGPSPRLDIPPELSQHDIPPIAALFVAHFDLKIGYKLGWKRSLPDVELEGVVEYKSLPSGLHTVEEDLIYFVHDQYAGVSAFANSPSTSEERNAKMAAVGVLVPLSLGRLGRGWRHAQQLKEFARLLVQPNQDADDIATRLEEYWEAHRPHDGSPLPSASSPLESPGSLRNKPARVGTAGTPSRSRRRRAVSDGAALGHPGQMLSPFHPALSLPRFFHTFGPLMFPLYRATLLRKRILLVTQAPIQESCDFVYDLSVLSNLPRSVEGLLSIASPSSRLRPLFVVGVHDIGFLEELSKASPPQQSSSDEAAVPEEGRSGWIACTTDGVLALKPELFDVVVRMPPPHSEHASSRSWPVIQDSQGKALKATQRDLRRWHNLRKGLVENFDQSGAENWDSRSSDSEDDQQSLLSKRVTAGLQDDASVLDEKLIEPFSWPALVVTSLFWWASAGEQQADLIDESEADEALLDDFRSADQRKPLRRRSRSDSIVSQSAPQYLAAAPEMASIAYFHRLTASIITNLADLIDSQTAEEGGDDEPGSNMDDQVLKIHGEDLVRLGLDAWSESDRVFLQEMVREYFGREAQVHSGHIECCGVKVF
ncbi:MAG: Severe Depolymerization of Actin [Chaenotheca gracillima]|nr:MAG: Severe Depolymerization of Actin [Chaenotheca gracillima]